MDVKLEFLEQIEKIIKPLNLHLISRTPKNHSEFVICAEILEQIYKEMATE